MTTASAPLGEVRRHARRLRVSPVDREPRPWTAAARHAAESPPRARDRCERQARRAGRLADSDDLALRHVRRVAVPRRHAAPSERCARRSAAPVALSSLTEQGGRCVRPLARDVEVFVPRRPRNALRGSVPARYDALRTSPQARRVGSFAAAVDPIYPILLAPPSTFSPTRRVAHPRCAAVWCVVPLGDSDRPRRSPDEVGHLGVHRHVLHLRAFRRS